MPVRTTRKNSAPEPGTTTKIVHLHGSFSIRTVEWAIERDSTTSIAMIQPLKTPVFDFVPGSLSHTFVFYDEPPVDVAGMDQDIERIIAPIPDKTSDVTRAFIQQSYAIATSLIEASERVVSIGYSFSPTDYTSYSPLLDGIGKRQFVVVTPEAERISTRLRHDHGVSPYPVSCTFGQWCDTGCPL